MSPFSSHRLIKCCNSSLLIKNLDIHKFNDNYENLCRAKGVLLLDEKLDIKTAIKDTLPTVFGYIGIGLAFVLLGSCRISSTSRHVDVPAGLCWFCPIYHK